MHVSGPEDSESDALDPSVTLAPWHRTLLNTNEPPDAEEFALIQSVISKTDLRLACVDDEIKKVQKQLESYQEKLKQLEEDRASLTTYQARNRVILSPLRRVPPEVLGEIFWWTLVASHRRALSWGRYDTNIPWVLTWVSSRWRAVSLSTPSLWSLVVIDYFRDYTPPSACLLPLVEAQIQRAQQLRIHFYASPEVDTGPQIQMFELLLEHSARWEELSIGITSEMVPLLSALHDRLPSLKRLWIQWDGPESQAGVDSIDCFQTAPSLVDAGVFNEYRFLPIALPVHQLTRYQLDGSWETHKAILKLATNLIEARCEIGFDPEPWPDEVEIVDLLHIQRLYVSDPGILNYLAAPRLEALALWARHDNDDIPRLLEGFLDRSACPLQSLCLRGLPNAQMTTGILTKFSCITKLAIVIHEPEAIKDINVLMKTLTVSEGRTVAPQLRCMFFGCQDQSYIDYTVYLEMLQSRWKAEDCALKKAALLTRESRPSRATRRGLHALHREGLDFLLMRGPGARDEMNNWTYAPSWN
ncbi:hypothetical protein DFH06DRAFT_336796 [Mycena polygramma]|nr:hypothetical protein DFH06DRAFT_336796 [Mycena polygramma]